MRKRLWLLACLIALECAFSGSQLRDSLVLMNMHRDALADHRRSLALVPDAERWGGGPPSQLAGTGAARTLDSKAWALIEEGDRIRRIKLIWQMLSLLGMAAILGFGMWSFGVSAREVRRRRRAEAELRAEQSSLEQRIEERTAEMRAEVEERRLAEERNRRQKRVLELLANNAPLGEILGELTASVAGQRRSWEAAIHLVEPGQQSLQLIASSDVPDRLQYYLTTIAAGFADAPESMVWASGEEQLIASVGEARRPWSELLVSNGVRAAWSLPLQLSNGYRIGTFTVYSRLFGLPNEAERELLDAAVRLASLVLDVRRMNDELLRKAYEDELTGVANRRAGENRLQQAISAARGRGESLAVLWIDLDRFKRVNDLYGHAGGDRVLVEVAKRIAACPGVQGSVARMGGDEFLVVLPSRQTEQEALETAQELNARICEPIRMRNETATVGASIGITMFPRDGQTPDELERHADTAMYQAKRRGEQLCAFSPSIREEMDWAISIEEGLREALETAEGRDALQVHYQPIFTVSGELMGLEALLRFTHPQLGSVSPAQFISIAEETKLILPLGRWVLSEVCRQIAQWRRKGLPAVRVSVNISAVQWGRGDFVRNLRGLMEESGVAATSLALEVTESAVMQNANLARTHMHQLKAMGVRLAMDDFGTGYSSLSHLHQLPLDVLKIDRSFTARLGQTDDSRTIVESVISMAHLMGIVTIAEGVETEMQEGLLSEMGCDGCQGFLYARPMPADEAGSGS